MAYDVTGKQQFVLRGARGLYFDRPRGGNAQALVGNRRRLEHVHTVRYGAAADPGSGGATRRSPPAADRATSTTASCRPRTQWNAGVQMVLPWATSLDVAYVGQHSYNAELSHANINAVDFGTAFLPPNQDPTRRPAPRRAPRRSRRSSPTWCARYQGYSAITQRDLRRLADVSFDPVLDQPPVPERPLVRVQRHDQPQTSPERRAALSTTPTASFVGARRSGAGDDLLGTRPAAAPHHEGQLRLGPAGPQEHGRRRCRALGLRRQRLAALGHLDGGDGHAVHRSATATRTAAAT